MSRAARVHAVQEEREGRGARDQDGLSEGPSPPESSVVVAGVAGLLGDDSGVDLLHQAPSPGNCDGGEVGGGPIDGVQSGDVDDADQRRVSRHVQPRGSRRSDGAWDGQRELSPVQVQIGCFLIEQLTVPLEPGKNGRWRFTNLLMELTHITYGTRAEIEEQGRLQTEAWERKLGPNVKKISAWHSNVRKI